MRDGSDTRDGQDKYDLLVIPGGAKGAETMSQSSPVQHLVRRYIQEGKYVGMICAGTRLYDLYRDTMYLNNIGIVQAAWLR